MSTEDKKERLTKDFTSRVKRTLEKSKSKVVLTQVEKGDSTRYIEFISKQLKANDTVEVLDLSYNGILDEGVIHVFKALQRNKTLTSLDLSMNLITMKSDLMKRKKKKKVVHDFNKDDVFSSNNSNKLVKTESYYEGKGLAKIPSTFGELPTRVFKLQSGDDDLPNSFEKTFSILKLSSDLKSALIKNQYLLHLNLANNLFTHNGCRLLMNSLEGNKSIRSLNISNNSFSKRKAALALGQMLQKNRTIEELEASSINLNDSGFNCLLEGLSNKTSILKKLNLASNKISDLSEQKLANFLLLLPKLIEISLRNNRFYELSNDFYDVLFYKSSKIYNSKSKDIETIDLSCNDLSASSFYAMMSCVPHSKVEHLFLDQLRFVDFSATPVLSAVDSIIKSKYLKTFGIFRSNNSEHELIKKKLGQFLLKDCCFFDINGQSDSVEVICNREHIRKTLFSNNCKSALHIELDKVDKEIRKSTGERKESLVKQFQFIFDDPVEEKELSLTDLFLANFKDDTILIEFLDNLRDGFEEKVSVKFKKSRKGNNSEPLYDLKNRSTKHSLAYSRTHKSSTFTTQNINITSARVLYRSERTQVVELDGKLYKLFSTHSSRETAINRLSCEINNRIILKRNAAIKYKNMIVDCESLERRDSLEPTKNMKKAATDVALVLKQYGKPVGEIIRTTPDIRADVNWIRNFVFETAQLFEFVHQQGLVHCNITPRHILSVQQKAPNFSSREVPSRKHTEMSAKDINLWKLIDFEISHETDDDFPVDVFKHLSTKKYLAPEITSAFHGTIKASEKFDVWAFGVVLLEIIAGESFTADELLTEDFVTKHIDSSTFAKKRGLDELELVLRQVVKSCLSFDPKNRPTFKEILKHKLLKPQENQLILNISAPDLKSIGTKSTKSFKFFNTLRRKKKKRNETFATQSSRRVKEGLGTMFKSKKKRNTTPSEY